MTKGTVDLLGHGLYDALPQNGLYLDMDGSTHEAGTIETKQTFSLQPGEYLLQFQLAGNQWTGMDSMTVSLGSVFSEKFTLEAKVPLHTVERRIKVSTSKTARIRFQHEGGDNVGMKLDNVKLVRIGAIAPK